MNFMNLRKLKEKRQENIKQRRDFVKYWAHYVREHPDKDWSQQQNRIINSQLPKQDSSRVD